eukprot:2744394-Amphidinium_carterae.1
MDPFHHLLASLRQPWELGWPALLSSTTSSSSLSALQAMVQHQGAVTQQLSLQSAAASAAVRAEDVRVAQLAALSETKEAAKVGSGEAAERLELAHLFVGWPCSDPSWSSLGTVG